MDPRWEPNEENENKKEEKKKRNGNKIRNRKNEMRITDVIWRNNGR